jgi:tRNA threonylcarbamoyladenosine biosynthesis protein TsaB
MHTIIAIETSSDLASAALLYGGKILTDEAVGFQTHSQTILPMVQGLLKIAGITLDQCDAIAFGSGPGSFTGVRTACGIAQGLAFGANKPVIPVTTLLALAQACRDKTAASDILTVLDARMGEVYWAQYRYSGEWQIVVPPTLSDPNEVAPVGEAIICGNGLAVKPDAFEGKSLTRCTLPEIVVHAKYIVQLASIALANGENIPARDARPLYLRNKVALTVEERQGAGKT